MRSRHRTRRTLTRVAFASVAATAAAGTAVSGAHAVADAPSPSEEIAAPIETAAPVESPPPADTTTPETTVPAPTVPDTSSPPADTTPTTVTPSLESTPTTTTTTTPTTSTTTTTTSTTTTTTVPPVSEPTTVAPSELTHRAEEPPVGAPTAEQTPDDGPPPDSVPVDTTVPQHPNRAASKYDGVYANGVPIDVVMATTRQLESGGDYSAQAQGSSASGAYQVIDSVWNGYGGHARAVDAPPDVQDQFAYEAFVAILKRYGSDVSTIPLAWYYPAAIGDAALMDLVPAPDAGNVLTPREYQAKWMEMYLRLVGEGSPAFVPDDTNPLIPAIAFPVLGPVTFVHDWHFARDGGERLHEGIDIHGVSGQPLRAAFDGVITDIRPTNAGIAGVGIQLTRSDGTYANYFHLNDDTPGTSIGSAPLSLRVHPGIAVGTYVKAGQIIGYMGDTGNAGIPHLHFELRGADGIPMDPYPAVLAAQQREQCSVGIGPWSTMFVSPATVARTLGALTEVERLGLLEYVASLPGPYQIVGPDGARWTVGADGSVTASGRGALITPGQGRCTIIPDGIYGTAGQGLDSSQLDWWRNEAE